MKFLASTCAALVAAVACTVVSAAPHEGHAAAAMNATAADNSTTTTNTTTTPATATPVAGNDSDITSLIAGLNGIGNFKILSGLLAQFPEEIGKIVTGDQNVTLLAPNDAALSKLNATLSKAPKDMLFALLSYHVVMGNYPSKDFFQSNHSVLPTMLNNASYVMLPEDAPQKVVISRNGGVPVVVTNEGNISFVKTDADISTGKLSLYPLTGALTIPGNLSTTLKATNFTSLNDGIAAANLSETLANANGLTFFAPTNAAFAKAQNALRNATGAERVAAFSGHFLNGTVAYSSDLSKQAAAALADMSTMIDNSTHLVGTLIAAGGQSVNLTVSMNGTLSLVSGNYSAKIVSTDHLYNGGVVHGIDAVLLNTKTDPAAAATAAAHNGDATGADSDTSGASQVSMAGVSVVITGLLLASGLALLM